MSLETRIENLENKVDRLADAIEKLTNVLTGDNPPNLPVSAVKQPAETQQPEPEQAVEETVEDQPEATPEAEEIDVEDVRAALIDLSKSKGKQAAKNVLADFDAAKVGDLKEGDYVKVIDVAHKYRGAA